MPDLGVLQEIISMISDVGVVALLVLAVWAFYTGRVVPSKFQENSREINEKLEAHEDEARELVERSEQSVKEANAAYSECIKDAIEELGKSMNQYLDKIGDGMVSLADSYRRLVTVIENNGAKAILEENGRRLDRKIG